MLPSPTTKLQQQGLGQPFLPRGLSSRISSSPSLPHQQRSATCSTAAAAAAAAASKAQVQQTPGPKGGAKQRVQETQQVVAQAPLPNAVTYSVMGAGIFAAIPFLLMILMPRILRVRTLMRSYWVFAPLALAYMGLLAYSYTPDMLSLLLPGSLEAGMSGFNPQFFPQLSGIQQLFKSPATIASIILHILSINLFLGRGIYLDGLKTDVPTWHSLLATFLLGPPGLLLHWLTKAVYSANPQLRQSKPVELRSNGGTVTILPYT